MQVDQVGILDLDFINRTIEEAKEPMSLDEIRTKFCDLPFKAKKVRGQHEGKVFTIIGQVTEKGNHRWDCGCRTFFRDENLYCYMTEECLRCSGEDEIILVWDPEPKNWMFVG